MTDAKLSIGQAIDALIGVLEKLDSKSRDIALATACAHLGIARSDSVPAPERNKATEAVATPPIAQAPLLQNAVVDIRTLKTQKQPKSAQQMACLVAYYLQETAPIEERKATITSDDIEKYFKQAGFKLPAKIRQVLSDSRLHGYFDAVSRGEYKLNAVGYNLVAHSMPSKQE